MTGAQSASCPSSLSSPSFSRGLPGVHLDHRLGGRGYGRGHDRCPCACLHIDRHRDPSVGIVVDLFGPGILDLTGDRRCGHHRRAAFPSIGSLRTFWVDLGRRHLSGWETGCVLGHPW